MHRTSATFLSTHVLRIFAQELRKSGLHSHTVSVLDEHQHRAGMRSEVTIVILESVDIDYRHHLVSRQPFVCDAPYLVVFGRRSAWFRPISTIWCDKTAISLKTYECFFHYTTLRCLL
jgi:hypothetical protein